MTTLSEKYKAEEIDRIVRWLKTQVDEYRCTYIPALPLHELLAFIYPPRISELGDLLEQYDSDFFTEVAIMGIAYNGSELVVDVLPILKALKINPKDITDEYRGGEDE